MAAHVRAVKNAFSANRTSLTKSTRSTGASSIADSIENVSNHEENPKSVKSSQLDKLVNRLKRAVSAAGTTVRRQTDERVSNRPEGAEYAEPPNSEAPIDAQKEVKVEDVVPSNVEGLLAEEAPLEKSKNRIDALANRLYESIAEWCVVSPKVELPPAAWAFRNVHEINDELATLIDSIKGSVQPSEGNAVVANVLHEAEQWKTLSQNFLDAPRYDAKQRNQSGYDARRKILDDVGQKLGKQLAFDSPLDVSLTDEAASPQAEAVAGGKDRGDDSPMSPAILHERLYELAFEWLAATSNRRESHKERAFDEIVAKTRRQRDLRDSPEWTSMDEEVSQLKEIMSLFASGQKGVPEVQDLVIALMCDGLDDKAKQLYRELKVLQSWHAGAEFPRDLSNRIDWVREELQQLANSMAARKAALFLSLPPEPLSEVTAKRIQTVEAKIRWLESLSKSIA